MSSRIPDQVKNKFVIIALILYGGYLVILSLLALPYIPEMLNTNSSEDGIYINPLLIFGGAAAVPLILMVFILESKHLTASFLALDPRILFYTTLFLLLQFGLNIFLALCLVFMKPDLLDLSTFSGDDIILVWLIGCGFSLSTIVVNIYIGWKWIKTGLDRPNGLHWFVGYIIYFLTVGLSVLSLQILNPSVKNILLWPLAGIGILGALNFFIVSFGLFIAGLGAIGSSMGSSGSDAFFGFVFMMGMLFMIAILFLPFLYAILYHIGVILAKRSSTQDNHRGL
ncbi:MAG: hypothetical protein ACFFB5_23155 [Promethearchaeota archaeon]